MFHPRLEKKSYSPKLSPILIPIIIPTGTLSEVYTTGKVPADLETGHEEAGDIKDKVKPLPLKCPNTH